MSVWSAASAYLPGDMVTLDGATWVCALANTALKPMPPGYHEAMVGTVPVGYWRVGEASGTVAYGEMGVNNGTYVGSPTLGVAGLLAGDSDTAVTIAAGKYVTVTDSATFNIFEGTHAFSFATRTSHTPNSSQWQCLLTKSDNATKQVQVMSKSTELIFARGGDALRVAPLVAGTRFVVATYDGATLRLFVDGVAAPLVSGTSASTQSIPNMPTVLGLGINVDSGFVWPLLGTIDEPAIWDRAVTPAEIAGLNAVGTGTVVWVQVNTPPTAPPPSSASMNGLAGIGLQASRSDIGIVDLQRPDMSIFLQVTEGLDGGVTLRGDDDVVPFRTGRRPLLRAGDARPIVLGGYVMDTQESPRAAYRNAMDDLLTIFAESPEPLTLIATLEDGSTRWIKTYHPNVLAPQQDDQPVGLKKVSVEVTALDPYWYGSWGTLTADTVVPIGGLYTFDSGLYADSSAELFLTPTTDPYDYAVATLGNADIEHVRVIFLGPSIGYVGISVVETGVGFVAYPIVTSQAIIVDNAERSVNYGRSSMTTGTANRYGEYLRLPPGRCTLRVVGKPALVRVQFTPAYR